MGRRTQHKSKTVRAVRAAAIRRQRTVADRRSRRRIFNTRRYQRLFVLGLAVFLESSPSSRRAFGGRFRRCFDGGDSLETVDIDSVYYRTRALV